MANKFTAEMIEDFSLSVKSGVKYEDVAKLQRIRTQDIPDVKKWLSENITRDPSNTEWKRMLDALTTLEASWKAGTLTIAKHKEEPYGKTVEITQAKLTELFGEVK